MKSILPIFLTLFLFSGRAFSQNYLIGGQPIKDCKGSFYDSGGPAANYGNNQNFNTTICSNNAGGTHIRLDFSAAGIAPGDALCFFDGTDISAPMLSCSSDYSPGEPFSVQATAANPSGCLTVTFNSDASTNAAGWSAAITCVASCQTVLGQLVTTDPAIVPADTGWIDVCPGERVFFSGKGVYPQNGFAYGQSDLTTKFEWNFGDGDISYGPQVSHRFDQPGGYFVQMVLTDVQGCKSLNRIHQRVRVAPKPIFGTGNLYDHTICPGDTVQLSTSLNATSGNANLLVSPGNQAFTLDGVRSDSLPLPDGTGVAYKTSIYLTEFSPGQTLTNVNDLEAICVNMEHSWMRDLEVKLSCPSGKTVVLHNFGGRTGSEVFLGQPNDNDNAQFPVPGIGYEYCWTPIAAKPTWLDYANTVLGSGNATLPAGDYQSFEPLANLVGCPLNGEWRFTAEDLWQSDNGYIFSWGIKFKNNLYPSVETFSPALTTWGWKNHPTIFSQTPEAIAASPKNAGIANYVFAVNDDFGCAWDTTLAVTVLPFTHPNCFKCSNDFKLLRDTVVCAGDPVAFNAAYSGQNLQKITFENYLGYPLGYTNHPPLNPFLAPIAVSSLGFAQLSSAITQIDKVCLDIETDWDSDLDIYLQAPNGKRLELSTGNGGSGDNYKGTCFSPTAPISILGQAAPFAGTYKPEGSWSILDGSLVDGDWKLVISDNAGPTKLGKLNWWNITFKSQHSIDYTWQNASSLTCANCPNPTATPTSSTTYVVQATDNYNCIHRDTAVVQVVNLLAAPANLTMTNMANGSMTFTWQAVPSAQSYQVNVNNMGWVAANGNLSHTVSGLSPGNVVQIKVRAASINPNCPPQIAQDQRVFVACNMEATLNSTLPAKCPGTATGSAFISVSAAVSPVKYYPDGGPTFFNNGGITNYFTAGNHFVIVEDAMGCRDTVYFNITEPPAIVVNTTVVNAGCNGDNSGSASASVSSGGVSPFIFQWQKCTGGTVITGAMANNLYAGCYIVTVTDGNACLAFDTIAVSEPPGFQFTSTQDSVNCYGGSDGSATIFVTGGQMPYTYKWDNGALTQTAMGLNAKFHAVTVTDAKGCQRTTIVQVLQPLSLTIDSVPATPATCFNSPNGTAICYVVGGTLPFSFLWETGATTASVSGLSGGDIITVTVTDGHGCTDVSSTVVPEPTPVQVQATNIIAETCTGLCNGKTTIVATGGNGTFNYIWSSPTVPPGTQNATALCPGTYTVTVTDLKGCSGTVSTTIAAAPAINIQFSGQTNPKCAGSSDGSVSVSVAGGSIPFSYLWSNLSFSQNLTNVTCGTYTVTVTDQKGCTKTNQVQLVCPPPLQILSITPTPVRCFGESNGSLQAVAQGGTAPLFYAWSDPNSQISATATNLSAGTYTLLLTDVNGCTSTSSGVVTQPTQLFSTVSVTDVKCFGETTGIATANPTGGTMPYTYKWSVPQTTKQITGLAAGAYNLTVTDANGCTFSQSNTQINQPGSAVLPSTLQTDTACFGANTNVARAFAMGGTPGGSGYTYQWSNNLSGQIQTGLQPGIFTVTATDGQGCTGTSSLTVTQYLEIQSNIATSDPTCFGKNDGQATVNNVSGGAGGGNIAAYNYLWNDPNATQNASISGLIGGQTYTVNISDSNGCMASKSITLGQPAEIVPVVNISPVSCFGLSDGSATVTNVSGSFPVASYKWSTGASQNQISGVLAGTYFVSVTDTKGCTGSIPVEITEPDVLEIQKFDLKKLNCSGDSTGTATAIVVGGTPAFQFLWANGATTATISNLTTGIYALTVTDGRGCTVADSVAMDQPIPASLNLQIDNIACAGLTNGKIRVQISGGSGPYRYSIDGQTFIGGATFFGLAAGDYTVVVKDANGCLSSVSGSVIEPAPLQVSLPPNTTLTLGDSLLIAPTANGANGGLNFIWRSGVVENLQCMDTLGCAMIQVKPLFSNTYTVTAIDENGCQAKTSMQIVVEKPRGVYVPTGFTPNGDLENDILQVFGKSRTIQNVTMFRVYDRWGSLLYEDNDFSVNDLSRGWDGTFRGKDCMVGEYAWYVEVIYLDGLKEIYRGSTMLIR